jgi:hypothetical protein
MAWLLVFVRHLRIGLLRRLVPGDADLLRCHIDFLLMALMLYVFAALRVPLPGGIMVCLVVGAITNPALFFVTAVRPGLRKDPPLAFQAVTTLSFLLTTVGAGGAAVVVALAQFP